MQEETHLALRSSSASRSMEMCSVRFGRMYVNHWPIILQHDHRVQLSTCFISGGGGTHQCAHAAIPEETPHVSNLFLGVSFFYSVAALLFLAIRLYPRAALFLWITRFYLSNFPSLDLRCGAQALLLDPLSFSFLPVKLSRGQRSVALDSACQVPQEGKAPHTYRQSVQR